MLPFVVCVAAVMGFYTLKAKLFNPEGPSPVETTGQLGQYFIHDETFGKQALVDFWGNTIISTPLTQQLVGKEVVLRPSEYLPQLEQCRNHVSVVFSRASALTQP